jgi:hypothetical protein
MSTRLRVFLMAVSVLALVGAVDAAVLYHNIGLTPSGAEPVLAPPASGVIGGPLYDSFVTGAAGFSLRDVQVKLVSDLNIGTGSVVIGVYSDSVSSLGPGPLFQTIGTVADNDPNLTSSFFIFEFVLGTPVLLDPNTRYWLGLSATDGSAGTNWAIAPDASGIGVTGQYWSDVQTGALGPERITTLNDAQAPPFEMRLSDGAVPEPVSLTLGGLGIAALALLRRRRAR